jgi:DNA polymerase elongation subunit (family B)
MELDFPWDEPVDEKNWPKVVEYCANDVMATEVVFEARYADFVARQILADLSGLTVNDTTQKHTARIIFGEDKNPQREFVYTDLSKEFPGYHFEKGISTYRDEIVGEGGYVYAEPGMYSNVALLDVASMHPTSIIQLNVFGDYTKNFQDLLEARLAIKRKDFDLARSMLGGRLAPHLGDIDQETNTKGLADALKIVINIVYGLTSAKFDNPFRDLRNVDNIVAKRGALFMIDLKHHVQEMGFTVAHIKTDSIKIPNATPEIIADIQRFGEKYGYTFEHEATYEKFCLVNEAVYIARKGGLWTAVGAQFQHPYVFKTLFSGEEPMFHDFCETKQVLQGTMYLDFDAVEKPMFDYKGKHFVGRTGRFTPVKEGFGGGILYRVKEGKPYAVAGTKGYLWVESEMAMDMPQEAIDESYFEKLVEDARRTISKFGNFEEFVS